MVLIEVYRGWEIFFDIESEMFLSLIYDDGTQKMSSTYSGIKAAIDIFSSDLSSFVPKLLFRLKEGEKEPYYITIIGICNENKFIYEDSKGVKHIMSESEESSYILLTDDSKYSLDVIDSWYKEIDRTIHLISLEKVSLIDKGVNATSVKSSLIETGII